MKKLNILLVEDEDILLGLFAKMLRIIIGNKIECNIIEAKNADIALDILKNGHNINLVLTDIDTKSDANGIHLLRFLKENFPHITVMLMTGYHPHFDNPFTDLADAKLKKPMTAEEIFAALKENNLI